MKKSTHHKLNVILNHSLVSEDELLGAAIWLAAGSHVGISPVQFFNSALNKFPYDLKKELQKAIEQMNEIAEV